MFAAQEQNFKICNFSTRSLSVTLSQPIMIPNNFHFILSTGRLESLQPFNLSVCHNWKAFKTLKNNRKKAGPFSVGTTVAHSDR
jgi:hypothetical protein